MAGLVDIAFATNDELSRYESEIVTAAEDAEVSLDGFRARALQTLRLEAAKDNVDEDLVDDDGSKHALALRDYATALVVYYYWRDQSAGRDNAVTTAKAQLAEADMERAADLLKHLGWPVSGGRTEETKDIDVLPRLVRMRL
jgi:hypothetical protein